MSAKGESNPPRQRHRFWSMATKWPPTPHVRLKVRLRTGHDSVLATHPALGRRENAVLTPCVHNASPALGTFHGRACLALGTLYHAVPNTCFGRRALQCPWWHLTFWWRGQGLNLRLLAHEASELPLLHPAMAEGERIELPSRLTPTCGFQDRSTRQPWVPSNGGCGRTRTYARLAPWTP